MESVGKSTVAQDMDADAGRDSSEQPPQGRQLRLQPKITN